MTRTNDKLRLLLVAACLGAFMIFLSAVAPCQEAPVFRESFYPLSVGNWWVYTLQRHSQVKVKTIKWKVTQREIAHGIPVFHVWQIPSQNDEPLSLASTEEGVVEADTERFLLKNPIRSGDKWSVKSRSLRAPGKLDRFEVVSVGKACSVGEHSFHDCATIREVEEANNIASLTTYVLGVGPVKYVYFKSSDSEDVDTTLSIESWEVH